MYATCDYPVFDIYDVCKQLLLLLLKPLLTWLNLISTQEWLSVTLFSITYFEQFLHIFLFDIINSHTWWHLPVLLPVKQKWSILYFKNNFEDWLHLLIIKTVVNYFSLSWRNLNSLMYVTWPKLFSATTQT